MDGVYYANNTVWNIYCPSVIDTKPYEVYGDGYFYGINGVEHANIYLGENDLTRDEFRESLNLSYKFDLKIDTSNVTNMAGMFSDKYEFIAVPNFDTSNVTNMASMFSNCSNLTYIPNYNTSAVTNMSGMFSDCSNLEIVFGMNLNRTTNIENMFYNCSNLTDASYAYIANILPLASNITNTYVLSIGLDANRFDYKQSIILNRKGYVDVIAPTESYSIYYS